MLTILHVNEYFLMSIRVLSFTNLYKLPLVHTIRYDILFALKNCQFNLAHELKENWKCFKWN